MGPCPDAIHTTARKIPPTGTQAVHAGPFHPVPHQNPRQPVATHIGCDGCLRAPPDTAPVPRNRTPGHPLALDLSKPKDHQPPTPVPSREGITEAREASPPQFPRHRAPGGGADRHTFSTNTQSGKLGEPQDPTPDMNRKHGRRTPPHTQKPLNRGTR